jgi:peptidoglycan/LPS O-acetylase OafA/YrhL
MGSTKTQSQPFLHIRELDGIRGIAALAVFFHHLCFTSIQPERWGPVILELRAFFLYGTAGVDIFFVLSGFLITSLLIRDRESPAFYRDFYWKRALRILPLYIACLLGVLLFIRHSSRYVLLSAFFIANFANIFHIESVGPFWSLAIEEQFYLIWPTAVRRLSITRLRNWSLIIITGVVLLRFLSAACFGHHNYFLTPLRCDGLAAGALLACGFDRRQRENLKSSAHDPLLIGTLLIGVLLWRIPVLLPTTANAIAIAASFTSTATTLICAAVVGLIIAHAESRPLRFLRSSPLTFFGLISYAFYMVHPYVMRVYDALRPLPAGDARNYTVRLAIVFAVTIAASLLSRYLIELPALSLRKRVLNRPAPEAETEVPLFPHHPKATSANGQSTEVTIVNA